MSVEERQWEKNSQYTDDRLIRVYVRGSNENDEDIN